MCQEDEWRFCESRPSDEVNGLNNDEHFKRDDAVGSLVREALQNIKDAHDGSATPFKAVIRQHQPLDESMGSRWIGNLENHLNVMQKSKPWPMSFITIEDFNTTGLEGDTKISSVAVAQDSGKEENFYYFWRCQGYTGKKSDQGGSFGIGSSTYEDASEINTIFGLTVRRDEKTYLMGRASLEPHKLGEKVYRQTGYYGVFGLLDEDPDFVMPVEESQKLSEFKKTFGLVRKDELGFSLVIPFPENHFIEDKTGENYAIAAIKFFTTPLIRGEMIVEVHGLKGTVILRDYSSVVNFIDSSSTLKDEEKIQIHELVEHIKYREDHKDSVIALSRDTGKKSCQWSDIEFETAKFEAAKSDYNAGEQVAFEVPIGLRLPGETDITESSFIVSMKKTSQQDMAQTIFERDGMQIVDQSNNRSAGVCTVVSVEKSKGKLSQLLRASENPAHTKWQRDSKKLRTYNGGKERLKFVAGAPAALLRRLTDAGGIDKNALAELFPDPSPEGYSDPDSSKKRTKKKKKKPRRKGDKGKKGGKPILKQAQTPNGIEIASVDGATVPTGQFTVTFAFAVQKGDAFSKWKEFDFNVKDTSEIKVAVSGGQVVLDNNDPSNEIKFDVTGGQPFRATIDGFPTDRDLETKRTKIK
ncbi:hypothetical protein N9B71_05700 [Pirellulales bacterium]|nr:hypothetical protein [Pirellulales bacterium]